MEISGTINQITDLSAFLASVLDLSDATRINLENANPDSFEPATNIRLHLANATVTSGFFPLLSMKDDVGNNGAFSFVFNESLFAHNPRLYFVAYEESGEVTTPGVFGTPGQTIPIFQPVYRSGAFSMNDLQDENEFSLFFISLDESGLDSAPVITQDDVNEQVGAVDITGLRSLRATIRSNRVRVRGRGDQNAELTFNLRLRPSTSSNLNRIIKHEIKDYELEVPFPANLCVDSQAIQETVQDSVNDLIRDLNTGINENLRDAVPDIIPGYDEQVFFTENSTLTCAGLSFPVVDERVEIINGIVIPIQERAIELTMFNGFPRRIA
jgi:hypothetical protein